jgi:hypothetical protein
MPKKQKKINPAEMTDAMQKIKYAALFRNPGKMTELQNAIKEFDESKLREIFGNDFFIGKAAYIDDDSLIWEKFIQLRINLTLPKEVIMAEVGALVSQYQKKYKLGTNKRIVTKSINEVFQVWDLYERAGRQSTRVTFRDIARITGRPLSTIKDQWRTAHKKIMGAKYEPKSNYTDENKLKAADSLCGKCPHIKKGKVPCYKGTEFYPCYDYLKIAGKQEIISSIEYDDKIEYDTPKRKTKLSSDRQFK